jgi:putative spermidine/putrescine transport system ATP-binding protein
MRDGAIEQIGNPEQIYNAPVSRFVAEFVGFENVFAVRGARLANEHGEFTPQGELPAAAGLAWRPRAVALGSGPHRASVRGVSFAGGTREYVLESAFGRLKAEQDAAEPAFALGESLAFDLPIARAARLQRY